MNALFVFLLALDFLLAVMLLDAEWDDERTRRLERVEARRQALGKNHQSDTERKP